MTSMTFLDYGCSAYRLLNLEHYRQREHLSGNVSSEKQDIWEDARCLKTGYTMCAFPESAHRKSVPVHYAGVTLA